MKPLADRVRPEQIDEIVGQDRWLGPDAPLRRGVAQGTLGSVILWGPPGCGKTTIARALATSTGHAFVQLSAVLDGVKNLRDALRGAASLRQSHQRDTVIFVDEIHRWNKAQQDALLPHLERGDVLLIGATTENPSFSLNAALRSRLLVARLDPLEPSDLRLLIDRALERDPALDPARVPAEARDTLARLAAGDARRALTDLERCLGASDQLLSGERVTAILQRSDLRHDTTDHYEVLSALIKSMRGSDPNAAVYWLARLIVAGADPLAIARRLVVFAAEDVGNADPRALQVATSAVDAVRLIGLPEARIPLSQATLWLACSPKSDAAYKAIDAAIAEVKASGALPVPLHLRNPSTAVARAEGYGDGYRNPHHHPHHVVAQRYLPSSLGQPRYYAPSPQGEEKRILERLAWWARKLE